MREPEGDMSLRACALIVRCHRNKSGRELERLVLTFQWSRVGRPVTSPKDSVCIHLYSATLLMPLNLLSMVDRRLMGSAASSCKLSREPCTLRGGVIGEDFCGRSVGRRAAGTYSGPLGGRNWRDCRGSWCRAAVDRRGEVGELLAGVLVDVVVVEEELVGEGWP